MKRPLRGLLILVTLALAPLAVAAEPGDEGLVPIFDGHSLAGWRKVGGGAAYEITDETIIGKVGPGKNSFLRTDKTYGDFLLKVDLKLDVPTNSGIQFRSHQEPSDDGNGRVYGYQSEVDPTTRAWSGGLYEEGRRLWLYPLEGHPEAQKAFKLTDWNRYTIKAVGPHLQTWVNGVPCADLLDTIDLEGFIALQVHAGKAGQIRFKNIRLKDLGQSTWKPLWDGRSWSSLSMKGGGDWKIDDGAIHGTALSSERRHGILMTDKTYDDFAVRLKFKDTKGNSGLFFRCVEGGQTEMVGPQAEISTTLDALGGLYEVGGRGWVARPVRKEEAKKAAAKNQEAAPKADSGDGWTGLAVVALGDRVVIQVDGRTTVDVRDDKGRKSGRIAFQLHGGHDMDVSFKDIEILPLDGNKGPE